MARTGRKARERQQEQRTRKHRMIWIGLAVAAALVLLLVLARPGDPPELAVDDDPTLGPETAPVTAYYFADFQCPHCRTFEVDGNMDRLREDYVNPGQVRLVFKDMPVMGDDSWQAAQASQFVWDTAPSVYWDWHRGLFEAQGSPEDGWASEDALVAFSSGFDEVDEAALREALQEDAYRAEVEADRETGIAHGVRGTPSIVVDGRVVNPLNYGELERALEDALADREA